MVCCFPYSEKPHSDQQGWVNDCLGETRQGFRGGNCKTPPGHDPWLLDHSREPLSSSHEYAIILPFPCREQTAQETLDALDENSESIARDLPTPTLSGDDLQGDRNSFELFVLVLEGLGNFAIRSSCRTEQQNTDQQHQTKPRDFLFHSVVELVGKLDIFRRHSLEDEPQYYIDKNSNQIQ